MDPVQRLANLRVLGSVLDRLRDEHQGFELIAHWTQGEFHHDLVVRLIDRGCLPGAVLVVSTNCNGGVKEVLCFDKPPGRWALWHQRCPDNPEFEGQLEPIRGIARTEHYFDPCELLADDARSELRREFRRRQRGGGWELARDRWVSERGVEEELG